VAHSYQDTGLGRQLLARLLQIAQEQQLEVLEGQVLAETSLCCTCSGPPAIRSFCDCVGMC
jgi:hypothetical protein